MIRLRGHHLVCLHYYHGDGLNDAYAVNLKQKVELAQRGETITIAGGADDICAACPNLRESICQGIPAEEGEILKLDRQALALLNCKVGDQVRWDHVLQQVQSAPPSWFETFCHGCTWSPYCDRGASVFHTPTRHNLLFKEEAK